MKKIFVFLLLGMFLVSFSTAEINFRQNGEIVFNINNDNEYTSYYNQINKMNDLGYLYISGDSTAENSTRISIDDETGYGMIERLFDNIWSPGEFMTGPNTLWIGRNIGLSAMGHYLSVAAEIEETVNGKKVYGHSLVSNGTTVHDTQILYLYGYEERKIYQPDE